MGDIVKGDIVDVLDLLLLLLIFVELLHEVIELL
jgi:hypothetical protein